jgi:hypothetical protein
MDITTPPPGAARPGARRRWFFLLALPLLAGLAWWWRGGLPGEAPERSDAVSLAEAASTGAAPAGEASAPPALPAEPRLEGDAALAYARARDGDAEAARVLAFALAECNGFTPLPEETERLRFAQFMSAPGLRFEGVDLADERQLAVVFELTLLDRARCEGAPRVDLPVADARALAAALVERAARAGDVQARARYARIALAPFDGARDVVAHADEVARRHALGQAWLEEALARREPLALAEQGHALLGGRYGPRDPDAAAVHLLAFTLLEPALPRDDEARAVIASMVLHGVGVPAERQAEVAERARTLRDAWGDAP